MSVNALDPTKHFSEFNTPLQGGASGTLTSAQRKNTLLANIGLRLNDGSMQVQRQTTPATQAATGTLTAAQLLNGIITSTTAAAVSGTLPLATALETAWVALFPNLAADDAFEFSVVATGANAFTIVTNTGWTDGGNAFVAVATATSSRFLVRRTAANTYTITRIA